MVGKAQGHLVGSLNAAGQHRCMADLQELCMLDEDAFKIVNVSFSKVAGIDSLTWRLI